jgi:hypothetical protein
MCEFEIRILPKIRTKSGEQFSLKDAVIWNLTNKRTKERTAQAFLRFSNDGRSFNLDHRLFFKHYFRCSAVQQSNLAGLDELWIHYVLQNCQQVEYCPHWSPKVNIFTSAFDTKLIQRLLTGTWWFGNVVYGPRPNPPK